MLSPPAIYPQPAVPPQLLKLHRAARCRRRCYCRREHLLRGYEQVSMRTGDVGDGSWGLKG